MNPTISKQVTHSLRNNSSESLMAVERERERERVVHYKLYFIVIQKTAKHTVLRL